MKSIAFLVVQTNSSRSDYNQIEMIKAYEHTYEMIYKLQIGNQSIIELKKTSKYTNDTYST